MPHGGYHGTVMMGGNVIQQGGTGPNAGKPPPSSSNNQSNLEKIKQQKERLDQINQIKDIDNRSKFLAGQTPKAIIADAQQKRIANAQRRNLLEKFQQGKNVSGSDFTGDLRRNLNSSDYQTYMGDLFEANPAMYQQLFPVSSGAMFRNISNFLPGIGTLQRLFNAGRGNVSNFLMNKGIIQDTRNDPPVGIANTNAGLSAADRALNAYRFGSFNTNPQPFIINMPETMSAQLNPYALTPEQIINRSMVI